jgi:hypothetical protein
MDDFNALHSVANVIWLTTGAICLLVVAFDFIKVKTRIPSTFLILIILYTIAFVLANINDLLGGIVSKHIHMIAESLDISLIEISHAFVIF